MRWTDAKRRTHVPINKPHPCKQSVVSIKSFVCRLSAFILCGTNVLALSMPIFAIRRPGSPPFPAIPFIVDRLANWVSGTSSAVIRQAWILSPLPGFPSACPLAVEKTSDSPERSIDITPHASRLKHAIRCSCVLLLRRANSYGGTTDGASTTLTTSPTVLQ